MGREPPMPNFASGGLRTLLLAGAIIHFESNSTGDAVNSVANAALEPSLQNRLTPHRAIFASSRHDHLIRIPLRVRMLCDAHHDRRDLSCWLLRAAGQYRSRRNRREMCFRHALS
jgi:hypothetical protein